ncbi:hypothetical protein [Marinicella meishanensis]|uniref:hypothetical protein n=1 Tax=Marinicella meishanensis TaxID=2873263 RepID=UPI001CBFAE7E|nr:hypothetical protein [Marinicella sp. NBU2979]
MEYFIHTFIIITVLLLVVLAIGALSWSIFKYKKDEIKKSGLPSHSDIKKHAIFTWLIIPVSFLLTILSASPGASGIGAGFLILGLAAFFLSALLLAGRVYKHRKDLKYPTKELGYTPLVVAVLLLMLLSLHLSK